MQDLEAGHRPVHLQYRKIREGQQTRCQRQSFLLEVAVIVRRPCLRVSNLSSKIGGVGARDRIGIQSRWHALDNSVIETVQPLMFRCRGSREEIRWTDGVGAAATEHVPSRMTARTGGGAGSAWSQHKASLLASLSAFMSPRQQDRAYTLIDQTVELNLVGVSERFHESPSNMIVPDAISRIRGLDRSEGPARLERECSWLQVHTNVAVPDELVLQCSATHQIQLLCSWLARSATASSYVGRCWSQRSR